MKTDIMLMIIMMKLISLNGDYYDDQFEWLGGFKAMNECKAASWEIYLPCDPVHSSWGMSTVMMILVEFMII